MTAFHRRRHTLAATSILAFVAISAFAHDTSVHQPETSDESPFLSENDDAMTKMMEDMAVKPTGNVDRDFVEMMIPHHQGAMDMAVVYLRYGANPQLRRLAQEIIVEQQQEIAAMRMALGDPLPASYAVPTQVQHTSEATTGSNRHTPSTHMMMNMEN